MVGINSLIYTYSFSFFIISVAITRVLSQSECVISVEDKLETYWSKSQVITPKLVTISIFLNKLLCDEKGIFV